MFLRFPSFFNIKQSPNYKMTYEERDELLIKVNAALGNLPVASHDEVVAQLNTLYNTVLKVEIAKNLKDSRVSDCIKEIRDRLDS
jgi:hypothetical protein